MTDHPLTDEMIEDIVYETVRSDETVRTVGVSCFVMPMRAAYALGRKEALKDVIDWLQTNLGMYDDDLGYTYIKEDFLSDWVIDEEMVIEDLKKAMRPQEES